MPLTVFKDIIADANMPKAIERTTVLAEIKKVKVSKTQVKLKTTDMFLQLSVLKTQLLKSDFIKIKVLLYFFGNIYSLKNNDSGLLQKNYLKYLVLWLLF